MQYLLRILYNIHECCRVGDIIYPVDGLAIIYILLVNDIRLTRIYLFYLLRFQHGYLHLSSEYYPAANHLRPSGHRKIQPSPPLHLPHLRPPPHQLPHRPLPIHLPYNLIRRQLSPAQILCLRPSIKSSGRRFFKSRLRERGWFLRIASPFHDPAD